MWWREEGEGIRARSMMMRSLVCEIDTLEMKDGHMTPTLVHAPDYQQWEKSGKRLAELGWTIPMSFTMREAVELSDPANTDQDIESYLVDFYLCDQHKQLRRLHDDLSRANDLIQWHPLLEQCFIAFESNLHLVTIPSLLSILEGAIAQNCNILKTQKTDITKPTKYKASQARQENPEAMEAFIRSALATFIEKLYARSDFSQNRPPFINRHWILHGRDATQWTVADALRLFNALQSVV
jgi:hypothetical protein